MSTLVRAGVMSFAHMHAYSYAECLANMPGVAFAGVWDDLPSRGKAAARQFGTKFFAERRAFLGSLDAVIICSENVKHREMTEEAAAAGVWVLCEKPLATTVADAKAMVKACKRAKVGLGAAFPCRYAPVLMDLKSRLDRGEIGTLYAAACTNNGSFPGGWFADDSLSGGGATMDHTVHVADALRWLTGKEFKSVYCELGNFLHPKFQTDDIGSLHLEMTGGFAVSHIASWNRAKSFPIWGDVTMELIGEQGVLQVDAFGQKIDVYSDAAGKAQWAGFGANSDLGLVSDFIASARDRRKPSVSGEDGLRAVEVTVAAYESASSRKKVSIKQL